jgi:hypothetical protein
MAARSDFAILLALVGAYVAAAMIVASIYGFEISLLIYKSVIVVPVSAMAVAGLIWMILGVIGAERPLAALWHGLRSNAGRWVFGLLTIGLMVGFFSVFTSIKAAIPLIAPFHLDPILAELDRGLHGGTDPWRLLHPWLGHPAATKALAFAYWAWFLLVYGTMGFYAFACRPERARFLVSMALTWALLGTLGAILLSSAGPCYFGRVTGLDDPFSPLLAYVRATVPVIAAGQDYLWRAHSEGALLRIGSGISAMPSLHVAMSVLCALAWSRESRAIGAIAWLFAVVILLASIHLGWHYAIDGYVGALGASAIWWSVGRITKRGPAPREQAAPPNAGHGLAPAEL